MGILIGLLAIMCPVIIKAVFSWTTETQKCSSSIVEQWVVLLSVSFVERSVMLLLVSLVEQTVMLPCIVIGKTVSISTV